MKDRTRRRRAIVLTLAGIVALGGCGSSSTTGSTPSPTPTTTPNPSADGGSTQAAGRCVVRLHGKGGGGAETTERDGVTTISPDGNGEGWGGRQWSYFPDDQYAAAVRTVADVAVSCEQVIIDGFSNGASFAAKLYCRAETFGGRLVGVVIDDPVVDAAVEGCAPDPDVAATLYWTGALESTAQPGWECAESDWTCEGGTTIGIDAYAAALGVAVKPSPNTEHTWYLDAPELDSW